MLIDRTPQVVDRAVDPDKDFIEMPLIAVPGLAPSPKSSAYEIVVVLVIGSLGTIVFTTLPASSY